jgi:hypothetical protein
VPPAPSEAAIDHQRLDHVARHLRAADPALDARAGALAASPRDARHDRDQVARVIARVTADCQSWSGREERLGHQELTAPLYHRDVRL